MKHSVEFSVQAKLAICAFHKKVFRKPIKPAELEAYLKQSTETLGAFIERYKDVSFFTKYKVHTFTALSVSIAGDRYPKHTLVLAFERRNIADYVVGTATELKIPASYSSKRLLAEAKYIEYQMPDIDSS